MKLLKKLLVGLIWICTSTLLIASSRKQEIKKIGNALCRASLHGFTTPQLGGVTEKEFQNQLKRLNEILKGTPKQDASRIINEIVCKFDPEYVEAVVKNEPYSESGEDSESGENNELYYSPLELAVLLNNLTIAHKLLQYGFDPDINYLFVKGYKDKQNDLRPLMVAAKHGSLSMVKLLLNYGANPQLTVIINGKKHTASDIARNANHPEIAQTIQQVQKDIEEHLGHDAGSIVLQYLYEAEPQKEIATVKQKTHPQKNTIFGFLTEQDEEGDEASEDAMPEVD